MIYSYDLRRIPLQSMTATLFTNYEEPIVRLSLFVLWRFNFRTCYPHIDGVASLWKLRLFLPNLYLLFTSILSLMSENLSYSATWNERGDRPWSNTKYHRASNSVWIEKIVDLRSSKSRLTVMIPRQMPYFYAQNIVCTLPPLILSSQTLLSISIYLSLYRSISIFLYLYLSLSLYLSHNTYTHTHIHTHTHTRTRTHTHTDTLSTIKVDLTYRPK